MLIFRSSCSWRVAFRDRWLRSNGMVCLDRVRLQSGDASRCLRYATGFPSDLKMLPGLRAHHQWLLLGFGRRLLGTLLADGSWLDALLPSSNFQIWGSPDEDDVVGRWSLTHRLLKLDGMGFYPSGFGLLPDAMDCYSLPSDLAGSEGWASSAAASGLVDRTELPNMKRTPPCLLDFRSGLRGFAAVNRRLLP
ncbi:hypothetical protein ACLOJK_004844 [Asimina triloba]